MMMNVKSRKMYLWKGLFHIGHSSVGTKIMQKKQIVDELKELWLKNVHLEKACRCHFHTPKQSI